MSQLMGRDYVLLLIKILDVFVLYDFVVHNNAHIFNLYEFTKIKFFLRKSFTLNLE